jgi:hypothetical protein
MESKVIYDYKDLALAGFLILKGNEFKGAKLKYVKHFQEFKVDIQIEGIKEELIQLRKDYEENKYELIKDRLLNEVIYNLRREVIYRFGGDDCA